MKAAKKAVDDEKARIKFEAENAERLRLEKESQERIAAAAEQLLFAAPDLDSIEAATELARALETLGGVAARLKGFGT